MSFPRYERYKDSGVEWLGEVPVGWEVKRVKDTTYLKARVGWKGLTSAEFLGEGPSYLVTGTDFSSKFIYWKSCYCVEMMRYEDDPFIQLRDGDLLITKDGTIGKLALVTNLDKPACLNSGIFLVRPENSYITEYFYWVLNSKTFSVFCDLTSIGSTIQHLYQNVFERFAFSIPSLPEQQAIAAFLDRETGKIDALVAEQERLIELLKEKRQAVISHAVIKGLVPDAPMKDSGIEWLGEVPEGWEVKRIKHLTHTIEQGWSPQCESFPAETVVEWGVLKVGCVNGGTFNPLENKSLPAELEPLPELCIKAGDLLISRANTRELVGSAAAAEKDFPKLLLCDKLYRLRLVPEICIPKFLVRYLGEDKVRGQIELAATGASSSMQNIGQSTILEMLIAIPSLKEQTAIVDFLDTETAKIDTLITEAQLAIGLLKERRSALISAAVTGKIDVRRLEPV